MPGSLSMRSRRAKGSWAPRLAGFGVVGVIAIGGAIYLGLTGHQHPASTRSPRPKARPPLADRVVGQQTVGLINFGPYDDGDPFTNDPDDHPLMLAPSRKGLRFTVIPPALLADGQPEWTADLMGDGSEIFIYIPTGKCLAAAPDGKRPELARCTSAAGQRWRFVRQGKYFGHQFAAYANVRTGRCLTAPRQPTRENAPGVPGPATLAACGPYRTKSQEMAFWWTL